jgi:hypothetical protein
MQSEIVFSPQDQSYFLSMGVTVQLPINDLVEVLLKFNKEQGGQHVSSILPTDESKVEQSAREVPVALPFPVQAPAVDDSGLDAATTELLADSMKRVELPTDTGISISSTVEDAFRNVPIHLVRQDQFLLEYKERCKWHQASSTFLIAGSYKRRQDRMRTQEVQREYLATLDEQNSSAFVSRLDSMNGSTTMGDPNGFMSIGAKKLSANAPVFTPGSSFTTHISEYETRPRAQSDTLHDSSGMNSDMFAVRQAAARARGERAMSTIAFLPPLAVDYREVEEEVEVPRLDSDHFDEMMKSSSQFNSFWNDGKSPLEASTADQRTASNDSDHPPECKQM